MSHLDTLRIILQEHHGSLDWGRLSNIARDRKKTLPGLKQLKNSEMFQKSFTLEQKTPHHVVLHLAQPSAQPQSGGSPADNREAASSQSAQAAPVKLPPLGAFRRAADADIHSLLPVVENAIQVLEPYIVTDKAVKTADYTAWMKHVFATMWFVLSDGPYSKDAWITVQYHLMPLCSPKAFDISRWPKTTVATIEDLAVLIPDDYIRFTGLEKNALEVFKDFRWWLRTGQCPGTYGVTSDGRLVTYKGLKAEYGCEKRAKREWEACTPAEPPVKRKVHKGTVYKYTPPGSTEKDGRKIAFGGHGKITPDDAPDTVLWFGRKDIGEQKIEKDSKVTFLLSRGGTQAEDIVLVPP